MIEVAGKPATTMNAMNAIQRPRDSGGTNSVMRRIADHDLRAEADAHHEARGDQPVHLGAAAAANDARPKITRLN